MKNQTHSPDWSKWASNYSMVKTEDFKVRQFLDNAVLPEKIEVLSKQHSKNKHRQAQAHLGDGSEKKSFKGGDNSGGGGSSNKQITCPCGAKYVPHMLSHRFCSFDCRKASRQSAGSDLDRDSQLLGSRKAGQQFLDKARAEYKKKWGKKKAGAHHASAKISFDDLSSASDASFSDVSDSADESDTAAAAAAHVKCGKSRDKRKRSKRKSRGVSANLAHVSKHAVVLSARSSAARVSKSAQVNAADDDEDSDADTRQVKRKSKKSKKSNRGSCSSFGMTATGDDLDDAGDMRTTNVFARPSKVPLLAPSLLVPVVVLLVA